MKKEDGATSFVGGPLDGHRAISGPGESADNDYLMAFARSNLVHAYRWTGSAWEYDGTRVKPRADELYKSV